MNLRTVLFAILACLCRTIAVAHPLPDLPVRSYFHEDGTAEIRVEVDPRSFDKDPEARGYLSKADTDRLTPAEVGQMKAQADIYTRQRLRFHFEPLGEVKPEFAWEYQKLGDKGALVQPADEVVLIGSWKPGGLVGMSGYRLEALELGPDKLGIPLNVVFLNFIGGQQVERYAVLFPGEKSFALDLTSMAKTAAPAARTGAVGVKAGAADWLSLFGSEIRRGFAHVVPLGLDHILFVLGVFLMTRAWKPLVLQITTFTVAHTLTLWLASAGVVNVPPRVVEPIIAASIVVIALENVFHSRYTHWRLIIVFAFGLIHGLGFAGAMSTRLASARSLIIGLVGINLGVEFGQLAVIAVALAATFWVTDPATYRKRIVIPGSILIALAGIWWVLERTVL